VAQRGRTKTLRGEVRVDFVVYQRCATRDLDNVFNALADALKKALVIEDDGQIAACRASRVHEPTGRPRIEVTIQPIAN